MSEGRPRGVFVSYRRTDAGDEAAEVADALARRVGRDAVFMDVSALGPGERFLDRIEGELARCAVCLVLIGPAWLTATNPDGRRRLDDPDDVIRLEVATALRSRATVIPVLLGAAVMPDPKVLPDPIADLATRHAARLTETRRAHDLQRLVRVVAGLVDEPDHGGSFAPPGAELVGRDELIAEIEGALSRSRLVTLTGVGGTGKTSVARAVLERSATPTSIFIDLAVTHDEAMVPLLVADAAGVADAADGEELTAVARALSSRPSLVVLDNCEHLLDAAAAACSAMLEGTGDVAIVATSREPLALPEERVVPVPVLGVPGTDALADVTACASVRLFVERARSASGDFELDDGTAPHVAAICRSVDGIPLAVELAAARSRGMDVAEIADRLGRRHDLLSGGARGGDRRHATMVDTLDWSYGLLDTDEAVLLDRLSVFDGGFDLRLAEQVCAAEAIDVPTVLPALVDRSLVAVERADGTMRYRLLEPVRRYAGAHLTDDAEAALRSAHALAMADLVERAEPAIRGPDQDAWKRRLRRESANLRSAVAWCTDHDRELLARVVGAVWWFFPGSVSEVRGWAEAAIERRDSMSARGCARVLFAAAQWALFQGDNERSADLAAEAITLDHDGDLTPRAVTVRGSALREMGELDAAAELHRELAATSADPWFVARSVYSLGLVDIARRDAPAAKARFEEAHDRFAVLGDRNAMLESISFLAMIAVRDGDAARGLELCEAADALSDQETSPDDLGGVLFSLADVRRLREDLAGSGAALRRAFELIWDSGFTVEVPPILERAAALEQARGHPALAITLLGASDRFRGGSGELDRVGEASAVELFSSDLAAIWDGASEALSADELVAAWRRGTLTELDGVPALLSSLTDDASAASQAGHS